MKRFKTKLTTLLLASALLGGSLVGCNQPGPAPVQPVRKYYVDFPTDSKYTIDGIDVEGYEEGAEVKFSVTLNTTEYTLQYVAANSARLALGEDGKYSFKMPAKAVEIEVKLKKIDTWVVNFAPAKLKVGLNCSAQVSVNTVAQPNAVLSSNDTDIEAENERGVIEIDGLNVKGLRKGPVTITFTCFGYDAYTADFEVYEPEHGELETDPLTPKEAYDATAKLANKSRSELDYYVEGHVVSGLEKKTGSDKYANFVMEDGFQIYGASYNGVSEDKLDYGTKVLAHGKLYRFNSNYELSPSKMNRFDNSEPYAVWADQKVVMLKPSTESEAIGVRIAPRGSGEGVTILNDSSNPNVATYNPETDTIVAGEAGTTKITFASNNLQPFEVTVLVGDDIHEGTEDDPLTAEQAWQMCNSLADGEVSAESYFIKGVVTAITKKEEKSTGQTEAAWGYATWKLKTNGSPFTIYSLDLSKEQYDKLEIGAVTTVQAHLKHYGTTMETGGQSSVKSVDNSEVTMIEFPESTVLAVLSEGLELKPNILPASLGAAAELVWASDNTDVLEVEAATGAITLKAVGEANVTVSAVGTKLFATAKVIVSSVKLIARPVRLGEFFIGEEYYLGNTLGDKLLFATGNMDGFYLEGSEDLPEAKIKVLYAEESKQETDTGFIYNLMLNGKYISCKQTINDDGKSGHTNIGLADDVEDAALFKYAEKNGRTAFSTMGWEKDADDKGEFARVEMWIGNQKDKTYTTFSYRNDAELGNAAELYILAEPDTLKSLVLSDETLELNGLGTTAQLSVTPNPSTAELEGLAWRTSDASIATVDENGLVTTKGVGSATITAYIEGSDPEIKADCAVTVTNNEVETVEFVPTDFSSTAGEQTVTHDPVSLKLENGAYNSKNGDFRIYKNKTMTISSEKAILKIEFFCATTDGKKGASDFEVEGAFVVTGANGVWTGNKTSIAFLAKGDQVRMTKVIVTFVK